MVTRALSAPRRFFLGTHHPDWLAKAGVPLFVSRRRLENMKRLPRSIAPWALDSGGFTELQLYGRWRLAEEEYVRLVRRFRDEIDQLAWAAPQDWMAEVPVREGLIRRKRGKRKAAIDVREWLEWARQAGPVMTKAVAMAEELGDDAEVLFHGTGLSVEEHQARTIENLLNLRWLAPDIPWAPVLQGWSVADYWRHVEAYAAAGIDLRAEPIVGVGSVCRRQGSPIAALIFQTLASMGLRLHGFGVKVEGLLRFGEVLGSADSLAWSYHARRRPSMIEGHDKPGPGRRTGHKNCANCLEYALQWLADLMDRLGWEAGPAAPT